MPCDAQTPYTCACPYTETYMHTHRHTCTHTDRHAHTWNKYPSHFTSGCIKHTSDSKVSDLGRLPCLSVEQDVVGGEVAVDVLKAVEVG